jgi:phage FluMu protein Com
MPIEFHCTNCQKLLRTQDGTAGKQAKCPTCGTILQIPSPAVGPPPFEAPAAGGPPSSSPFAGEAPSGGSTIRCPYCAEEINAAAVKCKHCGSFLQQSGAFATQAMPSSTCGEAIAALVLGLIPCTCIPSLLAIVFGHIALSKIDASRGRLTGRGMAMWGLGLGYAFTVLNLIYGIFVGIAAMNQ